MDASANALCARLDAMTAEAVDARLMINAAVSETCSSLSEGITQRREARRERDGELVAEKRLAAAPAVAAAFSDKAVTANFGDESTLSERSLRARADGAIHRAARSNSAAGCLRNCSERLYVAWGEGVLRALSAAFLVPVPALSTTTATFSSRTDDTFHGRGRDRADTAHDA